MTKRIDIIGQNGNDGRIYEVENLARFLAYAYTSDEDRWKEFVPTAIEMLEDGMEDSP